MEHTAKPLLTLVAAALAIGLVCDVLFQQAAWGVNVLLGLALLVAAAALVRRRAAFRAPVRARRVVLPLLLAASGFALRDSPVLIALDSGVLAACVLLGLGCCHTGRYGEPGILGSLRFMGATAKDALVGSARFVRTDVPQVLRSGAPQSAPHVPAVARGLLLAAPLLLVFGGLFASADPVFAHYLSALLHWDLASVWLRCAWVIAGTCLAGGVLRLVLRAEAQAAPARPAPDASLGRVEIAVVLGALDTLFLLFVLVQFRYFFGGRETVQTTVGMTYAAYARHGFFELVTVAGLSLPLLLTLHAWQERRASTPEPPAHPALGTGPLPTLQTSDPASERSDFRGESLFRGLAGLLLLLLLVVMASALARMSLYRSEYGLTELRVYTTAFMGWLAVVSAWFGLTVLRGRRRQFAGGAFVSAYAAVAVLFLWNPDARIVGANIALAHVSRSDAAPGSPDALPGRRFDADYAASLSADAVPALVAALPRLSPADRQALAVRLLRRTPAPLPADWRAWCWSRRAAAQSLARSHASLAALVPPAAPAVLPPAVQTITIVTPAPAR